MTQIAKARALNVAVSTKHSIELAHNLRYKSTTQAKKVLEGVITLEKPVPFRKFIRDRAHKKGMSAGQYPQKAARAFKQLVRDVEANATAKGLNADSLKITKLIANKASSPLTGGRNRGMAKRTHLEIEVCEVEPKAKKRARRVKKAPAKEKATEKKEVKEAKQEKPAQQPAQETAPAAKEAEPKVGAPTPAPAKDEEKAAALQEKPEAKTQ